VKCVRAGRVFVVVLAREEQMAEENEDLPMNCDSCWKVLLYRLFSLHPVTQQMFV
jgi:hypothetical protein